MLDLLLKTRETPGNRTNSPFLAKGKGKGKSLMNANATPPTPAEAERELQVQTLAYNLRQERREQWAARIKDLRQPLAEMILDLTAQTRQAPAAAAQEAAAQIQLRQADSGFLSALMCLEAAQEQDRQETFPPTDDNAAAPPD